MKRSLTMIITMASVAVILLFALFVISQTAQVVQLASRIHPGFGLAVLVALAGAWALLIGIPVVLFLRLPPALVAPESDADPGFDRYLDALRRRLAAHPALADVDLSSREKIEAAIRILDRKADEIIRSTAGSVFLGTAVSQNGRLDAFYVLATHSRMVWRIAHLYRQRPSPRELARLYANVAATSFIAGELDEIDVSRQLEPVLSSSFGALAGSVPGLTAVATVMTNSVLDGAMNAFLTLRVGIVVRRSCGALVRQDRGALRRFATVEAGRLLGAVVAQGTGRLSSALWKASAGRIGHAVADVGGHVWNAGNSVLSFIGLRRDRAEDGRPEDGVPGDAAPGDARPGDARPDAEPAS